MKKTISKVVISILILFSVFFAYVPAYALTASQLQAQKNAADAKAKAAAAAAAEKARQAAVVKEQLSILDSQTAQTEQSIASTEEQIDSTKSSIIGLNKKIEEEQKNLDSEKKKLNNLVSSWYMEGTSGFLEAVIGADNISEVVDSQQYYDSVKQQVESSIASVTAIKTELTNKKVEQEGRLAELNDLEKSQQDQKSYLSTRTVMKNRLLTDTNNAIVDLKQEQKIAEQQAAELQTRINQIRNSSVGAGGDLVSGSASWHYLQVDPSWSGYKIGKYATIGEVGCLLTSLTMIAKYYGKNYTPSTAADVSSFDRSGSSYTDGSLLSTPIVRDGRSQPINWDTVDDELANGNPVVLGVALGVNMGNSYGVSHFVVAKSKLSSGKYEILDPLGSGRGYNKSQVKAFRIIRP